LPGIDPAEDASVSVYDGPLKIWPSTADVTVISVLFTPSYTAICTAPAYARNWRRLTAQQWCLPTHDGAETAGRRRSPSTGEVFSV
jgi:hypothetical protein